MGCSVSTCRENEDTLGKLDVSRASGRSEELRSSLRPERSELGITAAALDRTRKTTPIEGSGSTFYEVSAATGHIHHVSIHK